MLEIKGSGGGSGKGGGGSTRAAYEEPNNLECESIARVVDLIGEGEIGGLVNGGQSIFFDDTALVNADGSFNFKGARYWERVGLPDQSPLPFDEVESEVSVGVEVTHASGGVVRTIESGDVDAVRVNLSLQALFVQHTDDGDVVGTKVNLAIDVQPSGGSWITATDVEIKGKTNQAYMRSVTIDNWKARFGEGPWNVRVRRVTVDATTLAVQDKVTWASYAAILHARFVMPDYAAVGLEIEAKQFGSNIPVRSYEVYGKCDMKIPSNYDPFTRQYTGVWDGTWRIGWTDNPAWVYYDLATNERYGLGQWIKEANIDKWALYEIARYCDDPVPDGYGNLEPRWTCNAFIQTREEAFHLLNAFTSAFVGMAYWASGMVTFAQDRPSDPTHIVCGANAIGANFNYAGTAVSSRASAVLVTWNDPVDNYEANIEVVEDPEMIQQFGWRQKDVMAVGCTRRSQAIRYGRYILFSEKTAPEIVTFTAGFDFADCVPGNVVKVADPAYAGLRFGGRLKAGSTAARLVLDQAVTLDAGETYTVTVMLPDGTPAEVVVSSTAGEHAALDLATDLPGVPQAEAVWILSGSNCEPRLFRVLANRETEPGKFEITAVYHNPAKYDWIYADIPVADTHESILPTGPMPVVGGIVAKPFTYSDGANFLIGVLLSWEHPKISGKTVYDPRVNHYEVEYQRVDEEWVRLGDTAQPSFEWRGVKPGTYNFRVRAIGLGAGAWGYVNAVAAAGPEDDLPVVTGLSVRGGGTQFTGPDCEITWTSVRGTTLFPEGRFLDYRVQIMDPTGTTVWRTEYVTSEQFVYTFEKNAKDNSGTAKASFRVHVRARDIYGNMAGDAYISVSNPAPSMSSVTLGLTSLYTGFKIDWATYLSNESDLRGFVIRADGNNPPQTILASVGGNSRSHFQAVASGIEPVSFFVSVTPVDAFEGGREGTRSIVGSVTVDPTGVLASLVGEIDTTHFTTSVKDQLEKVDFLESAIEDVNIQIDNAFAETNLKAKQVDLEAAREGISTLQGDARDLRDDLAQEIEDRANGDNAITQSLVDLSQTVDGHTTSISDEITARTDADDALGTRIDSIKTDWGPDISAAVNSESVARTSADDALSGRIDAIKTNWGPDISAAVSTEAAARTDADDALGTRIDSIKTNWTPDITAAVSSEAAARANADGALSGRIDEIKTDWGPDISAAVEEEATARASAVDALAAVIDQMGVDFDNAHAEITQEIIVRADAVSSLAAQVNEIKTDWGPDISAAVSSESLARTSADEALSGRIDEIKTDWGPDISAAVTSEAQARATEDEALSDRIDLIKTDWGPDISAAVESEAQARSDEDESIAALVEQLSVDFDNAHASITTEQAVRASAIAPEYDPAATYSVGKTVSRGSTLYRCTTAITTPEAWNPSHWTQVAASLYAQYTMKLDVNGNVTGISMANDGTSGEIVMMADKFAILDPARAANAATYKKAPFIVGSVGGSTLVGINGDLLVDGTIKARMLAAEEIISSSAQIKDGIITNAKIDNLNASKITAGTLSVDRIEAGSIVTSKLTVNAATASWAASSSSTAELTVSVTLTVGSAVLVLGKCGSATYVQNQALNGTMSLYRGTTKIDASTAMIGFYSVYGTFICMAIDAPGAGSFTYKIKAEDNLSLLKDAVIQVVELRR